MLIVHHPKGPSPCHCHDITTKAIILSKVGTSVAVKYQEACPSAHSETKPRLREANNRRVRERIGDVAINYPPTAFAIKRLS